MGDGGSRFAREGRIENHRTSILLTDLRPNTSYKLSVFALGKNEAPNPEAAYIQQATTLPSPFPLDPPQQIRVIRIGDEGHTIKFAVTWLPPDPVTAEVETYELGWKSSSECCL